MQTKTSEVRMTTQPLAESATLKALLERWGVLLTYESLGQVMNRSPEGLRLSLAQNRSDWARHVNQAKVKIGRRVLFRTEQIAALIDGSGSTSTGDHSESTRRGR
jgi:hypothetical protein